MMRARRREFRLRWFALLSVLLHALTLLMVNGLLTPAGGPYPSQDNPSIRVFFPSTDQSDESLKAEVSSESPSPGQKLERSASSILPESGASFVPEDEPVSDPPMVQMGEAAKPPDPRLPTSISPQSNPSIPTGLPPLSNRRQDSIAKRAPETHPQLQTPIQEQFEGNHISRLPVPPERQLQDSPDTGHQSGLSARRDSIQEDSGLQGRFGRIPRLSGNDLDKYAKLPPSEQGRSLRPLEGVDTVISLHTKDLRYLSYFAQIKHKIDQVWIYPVEAVSGRIRGQLLLLFVLQRSGHVKRVELLRSSGSQVLDKEAWDAVTNAAPFDSFPPHISQEELHIRARFSYVLEPAQQQTTVQ
jgi:TonB family protein